MEVGFEIGLYGIDVLSGNLARSMAQHDISVSASPCPGVALALPRDFIALGVNVVAGLPALTESLRHPAILILRAPRGPLLDAAFADALALLRGGDLLVDASDSWFKDASLRARAAAAKDISYLAMGLAPNENSDYPILLPGGRPEAVDRFRPFLHAAAPFAFAGPKAGSLGLGPSGHFIKMAHTAMENAAAEIVRECRTLLERGLGAEAGDVLRTPRVDPLFEYLRSPGPLAGAPEDRELAYWAVRAGHELETPLLTLEAASGARAWENREALAEPFCQPHRSYPSDSESLVVAVHGAMAVAFIIAYGEALALLNAASDRLGFRMNIPEIIHLWRGGTAWRSRLLGEIQAAFELTPGLPNLLFDDDFSEKVMELQEHLRHAVWQGDEWNIPTPALAAALRYIDTFRDAWLPINLVQPSDFHWTPRPDRPLALAPVESEWEEDSLTASDTTLV